MRSFVLFVPAQHFPYIYTYTGLIHRSILDFPCRSNVFRNKFNVNTVHNTMPIRHSVDNSPPRPLIFIRMMQRQTICCEYFTCYLKLFKMSSAQSLEFYHYPILTMLGYKLFTNTVACLQQIFFCKCKYVRVTSVTTFCPILL